MKRVLVIFGALVMALALAVPASAITKGGTLDGDDHPYVGLMVAYDSDGGPTGGPTGWRCSGTLIDSTTFVTAGHCTDEAEAVWVWTRSDLEPNPDAYGYPFNGTGTMEGVPGTAFTHPFYAPNAFYLYDLGVVTLNTPIVLSEYASLPEPGDLDAIGNGRKSAVVTAVGYGLQKAVSNPATKPDGTPLPTPTDIQEKTRWQADLFVVNTTGVAGIGNLPVPEGQPPTNSVILSGDAKHGGTCFGDSGGPGLLGDTLVAVNSFGLNGNCAGIGGMFRIDRQFEIDWINSF